MPTLELTAPRRRPKSNSPTVRLPGADGAPLDGSSDGLAAEFEIVIPADAELTTPYWLCSPRDDYSYAWPELPYGGEPFDPSLIQATCSLRVANHALELTRPAVSSKSSSPGATASSSLDPSADLRSRRALAPSCAPRRFATTGVQCRCPRTEKQPPIAGVVEIDVPEGWTTIPVGPMSRSTGPGTRTASPSASRSQRTRRTERTDSIRHPLRGRLYEASIATVMQTAPGLGGDPDEGTCIHRQSS